MKDIARNVIKGQFGASFKDYKNGNLKMIAFYAKKARGMMVRYIIDNDIENPEDLKGFNYGNYAFDGNLSSDKELVFTR